MLSPLADLLAAYDEHSPLEHASTIPASWYVDERIAELERENVFGRTWQVVARADQLQDAGAFVAAELAGEPLIIVRGADRQLRAFYNVCRHHAAAVVTEPKGHANVFRCPYHGWSYGLDGALKGAPEFDAVCDFDRARNGLVPVRVDSWEPFVFVNLDPNATPLPAFLGGLAGQIAPLGLAALHFFERRSYRLKCNWKVFVDNYLDGGYHVPHLHKALNSVLEYKQYTIETEDRYCLQSSPMTASQADAATAATRSGDRARYFWLYPNFMINLYRGYMDTNLVLPDGVDGCTVVFNFYFDDVSAAAAERNRQSIAVGERVNDEDVAICEAVQRGLHSRAYGAGRLSVRREAGEHLFHRLLARDLKGGLSRIASPAAPL
ncbi:MAG TPA: aromatic ring-hydroxylating dioxygenase subunit alpha [Terriglobales bacterium]|nr:aromatic ring-hydroxylating dioxygenase subunit alpha [Terriglobales bacterium]